LASGCLQTTGNYYQAWTDGGPFAKVLICALQSLGLVTCMFNWFRRETTDLVLHFSQGIPSDERVVILWTVGRLREEFCVAWSRRKPIGGVMVFDSEPEGLGETSKVEGISQQ
jgi:hypothetical protein